MVYNTSRDKLILPEYGRHIQKMVTSLRSIEDPDIRQANAEAIIELMGNLNPHLKIVEGFQHILWDHLFVIADFDLDIKSPFPIPDRESLNKRPDAVAYPVMSRKLRHLGRNLRSVIDKALVETDGGKKEGLINTIAYYMKVSYSTWHHEPVSDNMIKDELNEISHGVLIPKGEIKAPVESRHRNNYSKQRSGKNNRNGKRPTNKNSRKPKRIP